MLIPKNVILETAAVCNLRCKGCMINEQDRRGMKGGFMDPDLFKSIIDRIDFPTVVIPWCTGEPLMHPQYAELVKYVSAKGHRQYITTNGHFWNEELFQHITDPDSTCYQIIFSLDGTNPRTARAARPGTDFDKVMDTIHRFRVLELRKGSSIDVAVKLCQRGQDWSEVEGFIQRWLGTLGISYVCEGRMLGQDNEESMRTSPCQYFDNNFMVIRHDGTLVLCAYNDRVVNGGENPVKKLEPTDNLLEVYNSEAYEQYRRAQNVGNYPGPCATCGFAYTGQGYEGVVYFRNDPNTPVYTHRDYYNTTFSLTRKIKDPLYYTQGASLDEKYFEK